MRVVIAPDVWISALVSSSSTAASRQMIDKIEAGRIRPIISPKLLQELAGTLARPSVRKKVSAEEAAAFVCALVRYAEMVPDP